MGAIRNKERPAKYASGLKIYTLIPPKMGDTPFDILSEKHHKVGAARKAGGGQKHHKVALLKR